MRGSFKISSECGNTNLLKLFAYEDTTSIVRNAVNPTDSKDRLLVAKANFQQAVGFAQSESGQNILVAVKAMGIDRDRLLAFHSSANIAKNDSNMHRLGTLVENDQRRLEANKIGRGSNRQIHSLRRQR